MSENTIDRRTPAQIHRDTLKRDLMECNSMIANLEEDLKVIQERLGHYKQLRTFFIAALSTKAARAIPTEVTDD